MTNKKNAFWRFIFSLMPGAGEMYMGFLKMGVSIMGLFLLIAFIASSLGLGMFLLIDLVVWFYSFFHVHNLAGLPDEEFYAIEDTYLIRFTDSAANGKEFLKSNRRIIAAALILTGIIMTWQGIIHLLREYLPEEVYDYIWHLSYELPKLIVGIAIIALGIVMIRGKKKELDVAEPKEEEHGEQE